MRDGILALPGIYEVKYDPQQDIFEVRYAAGRLGLPAIWAAVVQAGRKMGREYTPEVLSE